MIKRYIAKEDIVDYYITQNHSWKDALLYFHTSSATLTRLMNEYDIKKPKELRVANIKSTKSSRYGDPNYNNRDQARQTNLELYGVDNQFKRTDYIKQSYIDKLGETHPMRVKEIKDRCVSHHDYTSSITKTQNTCYQRYGYYNPAKIPESKQKITQTLHERCLKETGYDYYCLCPEAHSHKKYSKLNNSFKEHLDELGINSSVEFVIGVYSYDFILPQDNILIELNPSITHNSTFSIFKTDPKPANYHQNKTKQARLNNYRCIHVWDWDDCDIILNDLQRKEFRYARKCSIKEIDKNTVDGFLNQYHLQGTCKGQTVRLGLYYEDELIQIMTFGKPRYNKNYEYELLRLCTKSGYKVVGGAERLFKHFKTQHNPKSIISYCDNSKFTGDVYYRLSFTLKSYGRPSKHWYNLKTGQHITDNLLRQRGYDQLFGTDYGKGTSNEQLMLEHDFVEIYDCGQSTFVMNL